MPAPNPRKEGCCDAPSYIAGRQPLQTLRFDRRGRPPLVHWPGCRNSFLHLTGGLRLCSRSRVAPLGSSATPQSRRSVGCQTNSTNSASRIRSRATCPLHTVRSCSFEREPTWAVFGWGLPLPRDRERLHAAFPDCLGSARGRKKFDQSPATFNLSPAR